MATFLVGGSTQEELLLRLGWLLLDENMDENWPLAGAGAVAKTFAPERTEVLEAAEDAVFMQKYLTMRLAVALHSTTAAMRSVVWTEKE